MSSPSPILELKNVNKDFSSSDGPAVHVLRDIDLTLESGSSTAIVGPSGSGKSTLLQIIGTLDRATSGSVRIAGQDVADLSDDQLAELRSRTIGFVFQMHHLLPHCTALENVLVPVLANAKPDKDTVERAKKLLDRVGLSHRLNHLPGQMSGGERQRTAIVRALINRPKLLLADEPTGALDRAAADGLAQLLGELNREEQVTLIVVTHAPDLAATMGRTLRIEDGLLLPTE
jgi:lipoprotein-releasing system ATP-binding protein